MEIRKATIEDTEKLALLGSETFWDAYRGASKLDTTNIRAYMAKAFAVRQITSELNDPSIVFLLASLRNKNMGFAKLSFTNTHPSLKGSKSMEICRIYLTKSHWGKGLGRELLEACFEQARQAGCDSVWLGVWQNNERAIRFYLKTGFEIVGEVDFDLASSIQKDHVMEILL